MALRSTSTWLPKAVFVTVLLLMPKTTSAIDFDTCPGDPVDIVFVLDASDVMLGTSGDFYGRNWELMLNFVKDFARHWSHLGDMDAYLAVVSYSATSRVDIQLGEHKNVDDFVAAVDKIPVTAGGDTNLAPALDLVDKDVFNGANGDRQQAENILVMIIGQDPDDFNLAVRSAMKLQDNDVIVNVIAATMDASEAASIQMLSDAVINENYWLLMSAASLGSVVTSLGVSVVKQMECTLVGDGEGLSCPLDVAILLDSSGSIRKANPPDKSYDNWDVIKEFTHDVVDFLLAGQAVSRVAIIRFSLYVYMEVNLTSYDVFSPELQSKILNMDYADSWTNTPAALAAALNYVFTPEGGARDDVPDVLLIITDGRPEVDGRDVVNETLKAADDLKNRGVNIASIGVTTTAISDPISRKVLRLMSSPPQEINKNYWEAREFRSLATTLNDLSRGWCGFQPQELCWIDLVFVIDHSSSIGHSNYAEVRNFVDSFVNKLDPEQSTRVGLVQFSDDGRLGFQLNEYTKISDLVQAIRNMRYTGGKTNTASAIEYMRTVMFTAENGDRPDPLVKNVAIVITDGMSNVPDKAAVIKEARQAKKQGIHMIAVGTNKGADIYELNAIASYPASTNVIVAERISTLPQEEDDLRNLACDKTNECAEGNPCQNGGECDNGFGLHWCRCPSEFAGVNCTEICTNPADIVFAFDVSGSVGRENAQREIDFLADIIKNGLNLNDFSRVAVEDFADSANVRFYLNEYNTNQQVLDGLDFFYDEGSTNTADALDKMSNDIFTSGNGDRSNRPNIGVIITDGKSDDPTATWRNARRLRQAGTHLISIGIGDNVRQSELEAIASYPVQRNIFKVDSFESLQAPGGALIQTLSSLLCNNLDECDSDPCQDGGTCTDLIGGYECSCRDGFTGVNCERGCSGKVELVFIFDGSSGMRRDRFSKVLEFATSIVSNMEVAAGKTRVAAILYAEDATVEFELDTYTSQQDVVAHLKRLPYRRGKSNTAAALRTLIDDVMSDGSVRDDAQKICIIITNAKSNVDKELTLPYAIEAMNAGIHMISVGVGQDVDVLEMNGLASRPRTQNVFNGPSWRDLDGIVDGVVGATCDDRDPCDDDPCRNGDCQDGFGTFVCECDSDFTGRFCERRCTSQMDLVFVLDLSGSVDTDYDLITSFTEGVIYGLNMNFGRARIGVVIFSDAADVWVYLDQYTNKEAVLNAISFAKTGGVTKTESALRLLRTDVFINSAGDRPGVANRAVIITDGKSNDETLTLGEAKRVKDDGVEIFVVALGESPRRSEVDEMATDPDSDHVVNVPDVAGLDSAINELLDQLCQ